MFEDLIKLWDAEAIASAMKGIIADAHDIWMKNRDRASWRQVKEAERRYDAMANELRQRTKTRMEADPEQKNSQE